jgi:hypothetical protein
MLSANLNFLTNKKAEYVIVSCFPKFKTLKNFAFITRT